MVVELVPNHFAVEWVAANQHRSIGLLNDSGRQVWRSETFANAFDAFFGQYSNDQGRSSLEPPLGLSNWLLKRGFEDVGFNARNFHLNRSLSGHGLPWTMRHASDRPMIAKSSDATLRLF